MPLQFFASLSHAILYVFDALGPTCRCPYYRTDQISPTMNLSLHSDSRSHMSSPTSVHPFIPAQYSSSFSISRTYRRPHLHELHPVILAQRPAAAGHWSRAAAHRRPGACSPPRGAAPAGCTQGRAEPRPPLARREPRLLLASVPPAGAGSSPAKRAGPREPRRTAVGMPLGAELAAAAPAPRPHRRATPLRRPCSATEPPRAERAATPAPHAQRRAALPPLLRVRATRTRSAPRLRARAGVAVPRLRPCSSHAAPARPAPAPRCRAPTLLRLLHRAALGATPVSSRRRHRATASPMLHARAAPERPAPVPLFARGRHRAPAPPPRRARGPRRAGRRPPRRATA